jgi:hypothetical protein
VVAAPLIHAGCVRDISLRRPRNPGMHTRPAAVRQR